MPEFMAMHLVSRLNDDLGVYILYFKTVNITVLQTHHVFTVHLYYAFKH